MARNKMEDLRDHLFACLERLSDEELKGDELQTEIERSQAVQQVAGQIIQSAKVEVDFVKATGKIGSESALFSSIQKQLE